MRTNYVFVSVLAALGLVCAPSVAQIASPGAPGAPDVSRVKAGTYTVDPAHTQVAWQVNHLGFTFYRGLFGSASGSMTLDPKAPDSGSVTITIPVGSIQTSSSALNTHLQSPDFFDAVKFPTATFKSRSIKVSGGKAVIAGDLTLRGVTKPVVLNATFVGAGINSMSKKLNVGFDATTTIKRSEYGINYGLPVISDEVQLRIAAAFVG